uniref:Uncharacterized protein n=1 Tax=Euplotes crassus TaxID=5936 RepID=A0A7S3NU80_EUPCR|mmetsp:Transcript_3184/g.2901  ORF Transcript_3184/g.2901 Transcript_3184/m.2901 type:complete len:372 (+) Transcript_3184:124-1239(+)
MDQAMEGSQKRGWQNSGTRRSLSNHKANNSSFGLIEKDYQSLRETFDRNSNLLREKRKAKEPSKYGEFFSQEPSYRSSHDVYQDNEPKFQRSSNRFTLKDSQAKPKFEHNLLLPTRNAREFKKLLSGSKNKFVEMMKNKHRLDTIAFKPARNTLTVRPMAEEILSKGGRYKQNNERSAQKPRISRKMIQDSAYLNDRVPLVSPERPNNLYKSHFKTIESPMAPINTQKSLKSLSKNASPLHKSTLPAQIKFQKGLKNAYKTSNFPRKMAKNLTMPAVRSKPVQKSPDRMHTINQDQTSLQNTTNFPETMASGTAYPKRTTLRAAEKNVQKQAKIASDHSKANIASKTMTKSSKPLSIGSKNTMAKDQALIN